MSPSRRQAIDEYQMEIEKENRKLQSDLYLAEAKKQLDYQYGIQEYADKAAIDISKEQAKSNIAVSEYGQKQAIKAAYEGTGNQTIKNILGDTQGKKYEGTTANIKKLIKSNYDNDEDIEKAILDIYTNFAKEADRADAFDEILGMSEEEALEEYDDEQMDKVFSSLESELGELNDSTRGSYEQAIAYLYQNGQIDEKQGNKLAALIEYNDIYDTYEKMLDERLSYIDTKDNKALKKIIKNGGWNNEVETLAEKEESMISNYGEKKYNQLLEMVNTKEEEIKSKLKNKGIDW